PRPPRRPGDGMITSADRFSQHVHLAAAVVEVIPARDVVAGPLDQMRDGSSQDGVAPMSHRERPGRIGADVLDDGREPEAFHRAAVVVAGGKEVGETIGQVVVRVSKVDEAGAGHLDGGYSRGVEWPIAAAGDGTVGDAW